MFPNHLDGTSYGQMSAEELAVLQKALQTGSFQTNPAAAAGDAFPLRVESLERTLKNTLWRMEHIRFWKMLTKIPASNVLEQYNRITNYGESGDGFISEIQLPGFSDETYERVTAQVKFMGISGAISHALTLQQGAHGPILSMVTVNKTMKLLSLLENALYFARSDLDDLQFDGLEKMIEDGAGADHIIDLRGASLSEDVLTDAALTIADAPSYGRATHLMLNPKVKADLGKALYPKARYGLTEGKDLMIGNDIKSFDSPVGEIEFVPNVFINNGLQSPTTTGEPNASTDVPLAPTSTGGGGTIAALNTDADASSQFAVGDAGNYIYSVEACNKYGRSARQTGAAIAIAAGDRCQIQITDASHGTARAATYYKIYRTEVGGAAGTERLIMRVAKSAQTQTLTDLNAYLPYTTSAFMVQMDSTNMAFKQLAPMLRYPLAPTDTSIRWMQLLYGVLTLYTPKHNVLFRNVGRAANYVGAP